METQGFFNPQQFNAIAQSVLADRQQYTMNLLVGNKPGVLGRISLVFSRRGYNIEALSVTHTLDRKFSRITVTTEGRQDLLEDIIKQVRNIIDVIHVHLQSPEQYQQEDSALTFYKVKCSPHNKAVTLRIIEDSNYHIVDFNDDSLIIQTSETKGQDLTFLEMIRHYGQVDKITLGPLEAKTVGGSL